MSSNFSDPAAKESALLPSQRQTLSEANRLLEEGKPGQAAPLFAKLAEVLASAGQPRRAANLHALSSQAFAQHHDEVPALTQARAALSLFLQYHMDPQASVFYTELSRELKKRKLNDAAETLANEFGSKISLSSTPASPTIQLPTSCPQCGAPVRSDQVHWVDAITAECAFCGASIRAQN